MQVNHISCIKYYKIKYCENYLNTSFDYAIIMVCFSFRSHKSK